VYDQTHPSHSPVVLLYYNKRTQIIECTWFMSNMYIFIFLHKNGTINSWFCKI
jgi:hypothetical protein